MTANSTGPTTTVTADPTTADSTTVDSTTADSTTADLTTADSSTADLTTANSSTADSTTANSTTADLTTVDLTTADSESTDSQDGANSESTTVDLSHQTDDGQDSSKTAATNARTETTTGIMSTDSLTQSTRLAPALDPNKRTSESKKGLTDDQKVAIGVSVPVAVVLVALLAWYFYHKRHAGRGGEQGMVLQNYQYYTPSSEDVYKEPKY